MIRERQIRKITALAMLLMCIFTVAMPVRAEGEPYHIYDYQGLMTEEAQAELAGKIKAAETESGLAIVLVTDDYTAKADSPQAYADDYFDYGGFGEDGILLLIDMVNRKYHISTSGVAIELFNNRAIEEMGLHIKASLGENQIYLAGDNFIKDVAHYGDTSIQPIEWLLYLGIAIITGVIVFALVVGKYKIKFSQYHYPINDRGKVNLTNKQDIFLRENVVSRRIETSSSGGGSSSHTSSSGRSHGGGGGSF